jgi:hypothetical protein
MSDTVYKNHLSRFLKENFETKEEDGILTVTHKNVGIAPHPSTAISSRGNLPYAPEAENRKIRAGLLDPSQNKILASAHQYMRGTGRTLNTSKEALPVSSLRRQYAIGKAYDLVAEKNPEYEKHVFNDYKRSQPEVVSQAGAHDYHSLVHAAYGAAAKETKQQFHSIPLKFQFHGGDLNYHNSGEMLRDINLHGNMTVFRGGDRHEYLHHVDPATGLNENEMFRAVHDAYGHGIHGNPFGAKGEEIAYHTHAQMYSPLARIAASGETRGQNSNVNYTLRNHGIQKQMESLRAQHNEHLSQGNIGAANEVSAKLRDVGGGWNYAKQASVALPPAMLHSGYNGEAPDYLKKLLKDPASEHGPYDVHNDHLGLVALARHHNTGSHLLTDKEKRGKLNSAGALSDLHHIASIHGFTGVSADPFKE